VGNNGDLQTLLTAGEADNPGSGRVELPALRTLPPRERPRYGCGATFYIKSNPRQWEKQRTGEQSFGVIFLDCGDKRENILLSIWEHGAGGETIGVINSSSGAIFSRTIRAAQPYGAGGQTWGIGWDPAGIRGSRAPEGDTLKVKQARTRAEELAQAELDLLREVGAALLRSGREAAPDGGRLLDLAKHLDAGYRRIFEEGGGK
jgi:hypothetical protein